MKTRSISRLAAWSLIAAAFAACNTSTETGDDQYITSGEPIIEGTPLAVGTLRFLNDEATTFEILDDEVPLNRRAAENLIAHRNGEDGIFGTEDDDLFDDLKEVLEVEQVAEKRLEKIAAYADANGWVPEGDELLGAWDNVEFSVNEAQAVLELANTATHETLDDEVPLDKRAADSIVAQRPFASVLALSDAYYLGPKGMMRLKLFANGPIKAGFGDECAVDGDCQSGLFCSNITFDAKPDTGRCADSSVALVTRGNHCEEHIPCEAGLVCIGTTVYDGSGNCGDEAAMTTREVSVGQTIPEGGTITGSVVIDNLYSVPEDIVIDLDIDHPRKEDLVVTLDVSTNTEATLWNQEVDPPSYIWQVWGIERDNEVNGTWTVIVEDKGTGATGTFNGFVLTVTSRYD